IAALQEFSNELGPCSLVALQGPVKSDLNLYQSSPFIIFDHSHEYHGDSIASGFALPQTEDGQKSLSADTLGCDITATYIDDNNGIKIKSLRTGNTPPTPRLTFNNHKSESSKPMTKLEIDLAEAVATPSPVVLSVPVFAAAPASPLGIYPSFDSVHESIVLSSQQANTSTPEGMEIQGVDNDNQPLSPIIPLAPNSITHDISNDVGSMENQPNSKDDGSEGLIDSHESEARVSCGNIADTENDLDMKVKQSTTSLAMPQTSEEPIISSTSETVNDIIDSNILESLQTPVLESLNSDGKQPKDYLEVLTTTPILSTPTTDISGTFSGYSTDSGSGYDQVSGSCSSDSATEGSSHKDTSLEKQRKKLHKRRLLVDDAKRKQEQLERVKAQLQLKALGKIREQVNFWEEKGVLEQKTVAVVEMDDEDEIEKSLADNADVVNAKGKQTHNLKIGSMHQYLDHDHGDTKSSSRISVHTNSASRKIDKLKQEPASPGNCQSPDNPDAPKPAPRRETQDSKIKISYSRMPLGEGL
ncbi:hypothetical protein BGZ46_007590, partial [Entomortierella lignicola]